MIAKEILKRFRVTPGKKVDLKDFDPGWYEAEGVRGLEKDEIKGIAKKYLEDNLAELKAAQDLLYADDRYSVLMILQAMDAAGKDGTIKHVMSGLNPSGCEVYSFKKPSDEELDHNFLWRCARRLPQRGRIGIFNRSYYEETLVVKVHPELLTYQKLPESKPTKEFWQARYDDINHFERHLTRNGTLVLKFFLHVSKDEQKKRFLERLNNPEKNWKFSSADIVERRYWNKYQEAYEDALRATSTEWAPWYVVPADHKWVTRVIVANVLTSTITSLDLRYPELSKEQRHALEEAKRALEQEDE